MTMLEHPDITRILETGSPYYRHRNALRCAVCDCEIQEDELYYCIEGKAYCPDCVREARTYA